MGHPKLVGTPKEGPPATEAGPSTLLGMTVGEGTGKRKANGEKGRARSEQRKAKSEGRTTQSEERKRKA